MGTTIDREMNEAMRSLLREELGRDPTDAEMQATEMLNEQMRIINEDLGKDLLAALETAFGGEPLALSVHDTL